MVKAYVAMFHGLARPEVQGQAFNFAMGGCWSPLEVVQKIQRLMNKTHIQPQIEVGAHQEILSQQISFSKAGQLLGWQPAYMLDAGLQETVAWYCDFLAQQAQPMTKVPAKTMTTWQYQKEMALVAG